MAQTLSNVVFSKNRPLQLEGYLESLRRHVRGVEIRTFVLYKPELFGDEYESVFSRFGCEVIREKDFHSDCLELIDGLDSEYVLFGVDDVLYFNDVDFGLTVATFEQAGEDMFGFSLRYSPHLIEGSGSVISPLDIDGRQVYSIDWTQGKTAGTRYPFELCGTVYRTALVRTVVSGTMNSSRLLHRLLQPGSTTVRLLGKCVSPRKLLKLLGYFYSPNTFESWNCRWCQNHGEVLPRRLFFRDMCASAVQVNMVNTSTVGDDQEPDSYTVEQLNDKYRQGYRCDIDFIEANRPTRTHCGAECFRLVRRGEVSAEGSGD